MLPSVVLAQAELFHLDLQTLARDLEQPRGMRDVVARLLQRAHDQLSLDARRGLAYGLFESALFAQRLHELALERLVHARPLALRGDDRQRGRAPLVGLALELGRQVV